ncbi:cytochrome b [Variovorax sp. J22P168]|uniref:cytochrome b n=1 Tax=Variovorax jilinensis TaxID=3053513 RepID=UPI002578FA00|nr:cytochrome b [Variovorax sp. J22P168]MDM0014867.1 cytochrome b [Variovorax sp. J22P168]
MSALHPATARYSPIAMALHWLLALLILTSFSVGLYMADLPFSPLRVRLFNLHKWVGITILALSALRLLWRLAHRPPPLPAAIERRMSLWQRHAHRFTLTALYLLFFAVPLLGWAYSSASGFPIVWFGLMQLPDLAPVDVELAQNVLLPLHRSSAFLLAVLVVIHTVGALKHHFIDHDGLLARMWPARRPESPSS